MDVDYNDFFDANGYTDRFRNGGSSDLFASIAAMESDFNSGGDTGMTGNRSEDPGFTDPTYKVSTYFTAQGYTIADAMTAIREGVLADSIPTALTTSAIATTVLPKWVPESLSESNYNNDTIGVNNWTGEAPTEPEPTPSPGSSAGIRGTRHVRSIRGIR